MAECSSTATWNFLLFLWAYFYLLCAGTNECCVHGGGGAACKRTLSGVDTPWHLVVFSSHWDIFICKWAVTTQCMTLICGFSGRFWALPVTLLSLPISEKQYFFNVTHIYICVCVYVCAHTCVYIICILNVYISILLLFAAHQMQSRHTSGFYQLGSSFKHILLNCLFPKAIPTYLVNVTSPHSYVLDWTTKFSIMLYLKNSTLYSLFIIISNSRASLL